MIIVMPMAGRGSRFDNGKYDLPKPLIPIQNKPMVEWAITSLNIDAKYIFVVQQSHINNFGIDSVLRKIVPQCKIVPIDYITDGQACSVLLAEPWMNGDSLISVNCDQVIEWDSRDFLKHSTQTDGTILTFENDSGNKNWSYAEVDDDTGLVVRTAEKIPISTHATVGIYHWYDSRNCAIYTKQMIAQNKRINGEFYSCPVYNEAIADGCKFGIYDCKVHTTGTPEELNIFLETLK